MINSGISATFDGESNPSPAELGKKLARELSRGVPNWEGCADDPDFSRCLELIEQGADPRARSADGEYSCAGMALLFGTRNPDSFPVIAKILDSASAQEIAEFGHGVLGNCVRNYGPDTKELAERLVAKGASVTTPDILGNSPLDVAHERGVAELVTLFEAAMKPKEKAAPPRKPSF